MTSHSEGERPPTRGRSSSAISNAVVGIFRDYTGRGPTKAKTTISEDHVAVVLEDTLLKAERSLVADGERDAIRQMRRRFQDTMRDDLVAAVEQGTDRKVKAFMSDNQLDPDYAVEFFVLEPLANPVQARPE
jgi:uncharacterized protein YbcI